VAFARWFEKRRGKAEPGLILRVASRLMHRRVEQLAAAVRSAPELQKQLAQRGLSCRGKSRKASHRPKWMTPGDGRAAGVRRAGAGRKSEVAWLYPLVKEYFEDCRERAVAVFADDLVVRFSMVLEAYKQKYEDVKAAGGALTEVDHRRYDGVSCKLKDMQQWQKSSVKFLERTLMRVVGAVVRRPQRLVPLTLSEERQRCVSSWRAFDGVLWLALGKDEPQLAKRIHDIDEWKARLRSTVVLMSDQIPFWVKIGMRQQLFREDEVKPKKHELIPRHIMMREKWSQKMTGSGEMTRQFGIPENMRYRVTLEVMQVLSGWFDDGLSVKAAQVRPALVVPGAYGRLSNLSPEGTYVKNEMLKSRGKEKRRKAGQSCGNLLQGWRELRDRGTEQQRQWMNKLSVTSQPAGFVDGVVVSWVVEELAEEFPQAIHLRDSYAAGASESCKTASYLGHQLRCTIAGKMTPVLQVSDTDVAAPLKAAAERIKQEMLRRKREECLVAGEAATQLQCTPAEILELVARRKRQEQGSVEARAALLPPPLRPSLPPLPPPPPPACCPARQPARPPRNQPTGPALLPRAPAPWT